MKEKEDVVVYMRKILVPILFFVFAWFIIYLYDLINLVGTSRSAVGMIKHDEEL